MATYAYLRRRNQEEGSNIPIEPTVKVTCSTGGVPLPEKEEGDIRNHF